MRPYTLSEYCYVLAKATILSSSFYRHPRNPNLRVYQEKKIKSLLAYAYEHSKFYRAEYDNHGVHPRDFSHLEDINLFPSFAKESLVLNSESVYTFNAHEKTKMIPSVSSGSSGKIITVYHNPKDTWSYALGRFRIFNILGNYKPWDKALYIYTSPYPAASYLGLYPTAFISTLNDPRDTAKKIKDLKPAFLSSYPSHMLVLMRLFSKQEAQSLGLKLISLGSELSTKSQRIELSEHFNCPVLDEYSSEELGWIAYECPNYKYHLWEDISYIEETGNDGEIVGTNLHNMAMPFIRYKQGDLATLAPDEKCECGRTGRILKLLRGRKNDSFIFDKKILHPAFLLDTIYSLLLSGSDIISDFCLIQESSQLVIMQIVPGKFFNEREIANIQKKLGQFIPATIRVELVKSTELHKTTSGKRNPIISRVNGSN